MDPVDTDPNFEPQQRARSNTWPLPRPDNYGDKEDGVLGDPSQDPTKVGVDAGALPKKNSSRRNAWGNMSYADLITQAIQSSPEKRLTLSQIYDWMVQNVPYFKDKGDSNSSAGWKNSIRHNLSLHNRFMRVQNEGTGKSSWWMINPDAKPGKAARRRATSMETHKYEKRRGRVKKKVEALRNGLDTTPSPSSSISESLDMFPESPLHPGFQLSPDFRPRTSSNASSCGRLSPIPAVEGDLHDTHPHQAVPPLSPIAWNSDLTTGSMGSLYGGGAAAAAAVADRYGPDQLVDTLAETMKLGGGGNGTSSGTGTGGSNGGGGTGGGGGGGGNSTTAASPGNESPYSLSDCGMKGTPSNQLSPHTHLLQSSHPSQQQQQQQQQRQQSGSNGYNLPPPYSASGGQYPDYHNSFPTAADTANKLSPLQRSPQRLMHDNLSVPNSYNLTNLQALSPAPSVHSLSPPHSMDSSMTSLQPRFGPERRVPRPAHPPQQGPSDAILSSPHTSHSSAYNSPASQASGFCALTHQVTSRLPPTTPGSTMMVTSVADSAMLRAALTHKESALLAPMASASQMMGHLMALNSGIPNDLDLSIDAFQGELECDVDQVIRHELSVDGNLDFNFADPMNAQNVTAHPTTVAASSGHHWVH